MPNQKTDAYKQQRVLSPSFITDLKTGALADLTKLVKSRNDLLMCFRTGYINVYYMGHSLYRIEEKKRGGYRLSFSFNHARYTPNHEEILKKLGVLGFKLHSDKKIYVSFATPPVGFWETSTKTLSGLIKDYFSDKPEHQKDYFKEGSNIKKHLIEKERQQEVMAANQGLTSEYFIYDMEYTQPRNNGDEDTSGRFDMLAIRKRPDGRFNLVLMELKCTASACAAKHSGVKDHLDDFNEYKKNTSLVETRKQEAIKVCNYYKDIFGKPELIPTTIKDTEVLFIFTDKAEDYFRKGTLLKRAQKIFLSKDQYVLRGAVPE